ncbi:MAG: DUF711 family protein [Chloroflexi bacterium]|nr:DUF711 family protein [Chloroflexota bacterium]
MRIRSITYFVNPGWPLDQGILKRAGDFSRQARELFTAAGYEVQSARLATIPFPLLLGTAKLSQAPKLAADMQQAAAAQGFDYFSLGPALPQVPEAYSLIPEMLSAAENGFASGSMTTPGEGVSMQAVHLCAGVIHQAARLSPDGFGNLRFTALANVAHGSPFFPAAYHQGEQPSFAIATEAADLAVSAFEGVESLQKGRQNLVDAVETHAQRLEKAAAEMEKSTGVAFGGIDFTLAPFPEDARSFGCAMEKVGIPRIGLAGSLAAAAILADTLDRARFRRTGFSGLMLPVLEDSVLARRAAEGLLTINELLLYSSVCGTGLDTIPLAGDTTPDELAAVLLDLACLGQRLDKPLTARLMPIPGKKAGDPTQFDFSYFANSRVLALAAEPLQGSLAGMETIALQPRRR